MFATPKSSSLTSPAGVRMTLDGVTSRWIAPSGRFCSSAQLVNALQRPADLARDERRDRGRHSLVRAAQRAQHARQRRALDVLQRQEQDAVVLAELVDLHHVRVVQQPQDLRLVDEHPDEFRVAAVFGKDPFDDDVTPKAARPQRARLEHLRHAAYTQGLQQLVAPEPHAAVTQPSYPALDTLFGASIYRTASARVIALLHDACHVLCPPLSSSAPLGYAAVTPAPALVTTAQPQLRHPICVLVWL